MDEHTSDSRSSNVNALTGQVFGHWTVLGDATPLHGNVMVLCRCTCGTERPVRRSRMIAGGSKHCGCQSLKRATAAATKHNMSHSKEYRAWMSIKSRTLNPNCAGYIDYGARGITICEEWRNSFDVFLRDMGPAPSKSHSIDRRNNNLGYSKENCRWATAKEQQRNRRVNVLITFAGATRSISEWEEMLGVHPGSLRDRFRNGWSIERAMTTPYRKKAPNRNVSTGA